MFRRTAIVVAFMCLGSDCLAALVLQSEQPSYSVDASGSTVAAAKVYLAQTLGTTLLSDRGGINSAGFEIVAGGGGLAPTLQSIDANPAFSSSVASTAAGSLYVELSNLSAGVLPEDNRVWLGTFRYVGFPGVNSSTVFTIQDRSGDQTYTAMGDLLDSGITPGTFSIAIPEPSVTGLWLATTPFLRRRRRA